MRFILPFCLLTLLISSGLPVQALPKKALPVEKPAVIAQSQNGPYTLRILKAKWATLKEVSLWRRPDRAITLWVDVVSTQPFTPSAADKESGRISLAARLMDGYARRTDFNSQLISVGFDHYARNAPYVPGTSPPGQIIWRVQNIDPHTPEVLLGWEFLVPGSSPKRADWPPSLLDKENSALRVSKNESAETRRFSIRLPLSVVEPPDAQITAAGTPKSVQFEAKNWQVWPAFAFKSKSHKVSMLGATDGQSSPEVESWRVDIPVVASSKMGGAVWNFDLRDRQGHEWPAGNSLQFGQNPNSFWRPDGQLNPAGVQTIDLSAEFAPQLSPDGPWTLEARRSGKVEQIVNGEFVNIGLPPTAEPLRPQTAIGAWILREVRNFGPENPLPQEWAPTGQPSGIAVKLALKVPSSDIWTRAFLREVTLSTGDALEPYDNALMVVGRETTADGGTIVFQMLLPPVADANAKLNFKVDSGFCREGTSKFTIPGLTFPILKRNK